MCVLALLTELYLTAAAAAAGAAADTAAAAAAADTAISVRRLHRCTTLGGSYRARSWAPS
jgi:hypothetical protein